MSVATTDYPRSAFDLIEEFDHLTTTAQVREHLQSALASFGYSTFRMTGVPNPPARIEPHVLIDAWPQAFSEHYARENYYDDDPVAAWCRRTTSAFEWSEAIYDPRAWPRAAEVMGEAARFGMRAGLCVPVGRLNGVRSYLTAAGEQPDFEADAKRAVQVIGLYAHNRALALVDAGNAMLVPGGILTKRERETLQWTALGKSSWEIAMILGVSERTVNWYISTAQRKLGAVNRTQAVVHAMRAGEIKT